MHSQIDRTAIWLSARLAPHFFTDSLDSPSFADQLHEVRLTVPDLDGPGDYPVKASSHIGDLNALIRIAQWRGAKPTLIYHHGTAEKPFDASFRRIFPQVKDVDANLIVVRAPYHEEPKRFTNKMRRVANYLAMMAVGVRAIEHVVNVARSRGATKVIIAGASLGGAITNRHHIHCNTADAYCPMLASPLMGDVFLESAYAMKVGKRAKADPDRIRSLFNFHREWASVPDKNVFPLLAKHDAVIPYAHHRAAYGRLTVATIPKGHITAMLSGKLMRDHLAKQMSAAIAGPRPG
ncbi:MAG: hypothetical protein FJ039_03520 [Chloroflexi bacterium]|nr:hypothetical protein [Chloroflexota bacterium]